MDIAIVGADGTGKSTIVDALSEQLGYRALHLTQFDSYNSTPAWLFGKALKWSASQAQRLGSAIGGALSGTIRLSYLLPTLIEERELGENVVWDRHPCIDTLAYARVYLPSGKVGEVMSREVRGHTRDYLYSLFGVPEFVFYLDGNSRCPLPSPIDGEVTIVGSGGNSTTEIKGPRGRVRMLHMSNFLVKKGDKVVEGQIIGNQSDVMPKSPNVHLHIEAPEEVLREYVPKMLNGSYVPGAKTPKTQEEKSQEVVDNVVQGVKDFFGSWGS